MAGTPVKIHSVAEGHLLLMVTSCAACGKGPLEAGENEPVDIGGMSGRRVVARCKACGERQEFQFDLGEMLEPDDPAGPPRINPTDEPSRAIDLAQWLMLFEAIVRAADQEADAGESRRLGYEAAQCLDEALKFYPSGEAEWPDESAFFYDWTLARYREHRHVYARTRLTELRGRLPSLTKMEQRLAGQGAGRRKRRWWAFWRR